MSATGAAEDQSRLADPRSLQGSLAQQADTFEINHRCIVPLTILGTIQMLVPTFVTSGTAGQMLFVDFAYLCLYAACMWLLWRRQAWLREGLPRLFDTTRLLEEFAGLELYARPELLPATKLLAPPVQRQRNLAQQAREFAARASRRPAYKGYFLSLPFLGLWAAGCLGAVMLLWLFCGVAGGFDNLLQWWLAALPMLILPLAAIPAWQNSVAVEMLHYFRNELISSELASRLRQPAPK